MNNEEESEAAAARASARQYDWRPRPDPTILTTQQLRETEAAINRGWHEGLASMRELLEQRLDGMDTATKLLAERISGIIPDSLHGRDVLRTEFAAQLLSQRELIESRIGAIDAATKLLATDVAKTPTDVELRSKNLREYLLSQIQLALAETKRVEDVTHEKFAAVDGLFGSNALALTAALAAQEKAASEQNKSNTLAIDKSATSTKETISANAAQTQTSLQSLQAADADIKERMVRLEAAVASGALLRANTLADSTYDQTNNLGRQAASRQTVSMIIAGISALVAIIAVVFATVH
jgi:hypothetical protein